MATLGTATVHLGWNRSLYTGLGPGGPNESMAARFMLASSRMAVCRPPQVSKNRSVPVFAVADSQHHNFAKSSISCGFLCIKVT